MQRDTREALSCVLRVYHRYTLCIYSALVSIPMEPSVGERQGLASPLLSMPSRLNRKRRLELSQKMFLPEHVYSCVHAPPLILTVVCAHSSTNHHGSKCTLLYQSSLVCACSSMIITVMCARSSTNPHSGVCILLY